MLEDILELVRWGKKMRLMLGFLVTILLMVVLVPVLGLTLFKPHLISKIEQSGSIVVSGTLKLGDLSISSIFPFQIRLSNVQFQIPEQGLTADVKEVEIVLSDLLNAITSTGKFNLRVKIQAGSVSMIPSSDTSATKSVAAPTGGNSKPFALPIAAVQFFVDDFKFEIFDDTSKSAIYSIEKFKLKVETTELLNNQYPVQIESSGVARLKLVPVPLPFSLSCTDCRFDGQNALIKESGFAVFGLKGSVTGQFDSSSAAYVVNANLDVPDLSVANSFAEALKGSRIQGSLKGTVNAKGSATQKYPLIDFSISAKDVKADIDMKEPSHQAQGQLTAAVDLMGQVDNELTLKKASAVLDLSNLAINHPKYIKKPAGVLAKLSLSGQQKGEQIDLSQSKLEFSQVQLLASGSVQTRPKARSVIRLNLRNSLINGLEKYFPMLAEYPLKGMMSGDATYTGDIFESSTATIQLQSFNLKDISGRLSINSGNLRLQGPFNLNANLSGNYNAKLPAQTKIAGRVFAKLTDFSYKSPAETAGAKTGVKNMVPAKAEALLPNWPILKNSQVNFTLALDRVQFNELLASQISTKGLFQAGRIKASGQVGKVFDGSVNLLNAEFNGFANQQELPFHVTVNEIGIQAFLIWLMPDFKDSAAGRIKAEILGKTLFPLPEQILSGLTASGSLETTDAVLSSIDVNKIIRSKINENPILKKYVSVKDGDAKLAIAGQFAVANSEIKMEKFVMLSSDGNEITGAGRFKDTKNNSFKASAKLANPKVLTDCKTILDNGGRLVLKAVEVKNLEWTNSNAILGGLIGDLVNCEIKREADKAGKKLQKDLQKQLNKGLQNLLGN